MDKSRIKELNQLFNELTISGYAFNTDFADIRIKLTELYTIVHELATIDDTYKLPENFTRSIDYFTNVIIEYIDNFNLTYKQGVDNLKEFKNDLYYKFMEFYNQEMDLNYDKNNHSNKLIIFYSIVKSYISINNNNDLKLNNFIQDIETEFLNKLNFINESSNNVQIILEELSKRASEHPVSDYAIVFEKESSINNIFAKRWLYCGIGISIIFVLSIILFSIYGWFEIVVRDEAGKLLYYNFSNLFTKVVLVAIQVFFISFSFKQFNVNKHLETLNKHRQNALNSYKLFQQSIIGNDNGSHNALMIQVAKSIYEHPQSTGFLNENGQQMNSGIVELTKIISDNKTN